MAQTTKQDGIQSQNTVGLSLYKKLIEVRKMAPYIKKDAKGFNYTYVKESTVLGLISGAMNDQGLLLVQEMVDLQTVTVRVPATKTSPAIEVPGIKGKFQYTWINADNPEERLSCIQFIQDSDSEAQACGGLMTYGMRYFLLKFFNVPTDNLDPDDFKGLMDKILDEEEGSKSSVTAEKEATQKTNQQTHPSNTKAEAKRILPKEPLTQPQINFMHKLLEERGITYEEVQELWSLPALKDVLQNQLEEIVKNVKDNWQPKAKK